MRLYLYILAGWVVAAILHLVVESNAFSCIVTVGKPRETFDLEAFVSEVSRKWKINAVALLTMAVKCKKEGKSPLQKRIREV